MKIFSAPSLFWSSSSLPLPPALVLLLITPSTCSLPTPTARTLARSLALARCYQQSLFLAHPRAAHHQQLGPPPSLIDSCAIPPPVIPVKSITRAGGFLAAAAGVEAASRSENPLWLRLRTGHERRRTLDQVAGAAMEHQPPGDGDPDGELDSAEEGCRHDCGEDFRWMMNFRNGEMREREE